MRFYSRRKKARSGVPSPRWTLEHLDCTVSHCPQARSPLPVSPMNGMLSKHGAWICILFLFPFTLTGPPRPRCSISIWQMNSRVHNGGIWLSLGFPTHTYTSSSVSIGYLSTL